MPLSGNQLVVFTDGGSLSDQEMQDLARETNLSETTFIIPRDVATEAREGVRVRIFTIAEELPFAGHPTLGTASVIHRERGLQNVTLDLKVGRIPVRFENRSQGLFGTMNQKDPVFGAIHDAHRIARVGGISASEIRDDVPIQTVSTGLPFIVVPVKTLESMRAIVYNRRAAEEYLASTDAFCLYWFCMETESREAQIHARMLFYDGEDPATGSATGCGISYLVKQGLVAAECDIAFEQGVEMKRPSRIVARARLQGDRVTSVQVGGHVVEVARGNYTLA
jgi:trans-2,3-dihydro-3-hydroxyanthranilate isomerase